MTNLEAIKALCTRTVSGFYPDRNVLMFTLENAGINPDGKLIPGNVDIAKLAIKIIQGMAETSHTEGGLSSGWDQERIEKNIIALCNEYGLDSSEFVQLSSITDGSNYW